MREIIKGSAITSLGTAFSLLAHAVTNKVMAVVLGPAGVGLFSLLRQVQQTFVTLGSLNGQNAIVQKVASTQSPERENYLASIFWVQLAGMALAALVMALGAPYLAEILLGPQGLEHILLLRLLGGAIFLGVSLLFLQAIINGHRDLRHLTKIQWVGALTTMALVYPAAQLAKMGYGEAIIGLWTVGLGAQILSAGLYVHRAGWWTGVQQHLAAGVLGIWVRQFFAIAGTTMLTGLATTATLLFLRGWIIQHEGLAHGGQFDVAWTLSMMYIGLVVNSFGTYYLPKLSSMADPEERNVLINQIMRLTILVLAPLVAMVIVLKPVVILVLYSPQFLPALHTMRWMLVGDYLKVSSWVFGMLLLARADMRSFFWMEISWNGVFLSGSLLAMTFLGGEEGAGLAFLMAYLFYFWATYRYAHKKQAIHLDRQVLLTWGGGFGLVVLASLLTWEDNKVAWLKISEILVITLVFSWVSVTAKEKTSLMNMVGSFKNKYFK